MYLHLFTFALVGLALGASKSGAADEKKLPRCFMDLTVDGKPLGRIVVELRSDVVPKTAENFAHCAPARRALVTRGAPSIA